MFKFVKHVPESFPQARSRSFNLSRRDSGRISRRPLTSPSPTRSSSSSSGTSSQISMLLLSDVPRFDRTGKRHEPRRDPIPIPVFDFFVRLVRDEIEC